MTKQILGIHHITAIAGDPQHNIDFYTDLLGLRLVKVTVNFDDPGSYHLYYGDGQGSPGTILTFFAWPGARQGRRGNGQVTVTSFATPQGSLAFWRGRLTANGLRFDGPFERFGQPAIAFADEDGLRVTGDSMQQGGGRGLGRWPPSTGVVRLPLVNEVQLDRHLAYQFLNVGPNLRTADDVDQHRAYELTGRPSA